MIRRNTDQSLEELHKRQHAELEALLQKSNNTRRDRKRMAIRHVNEFVRLVKKESAEQIRREWRESNRKRKQQALGCQDEAAEATV